MYSQRETEQIVRTCYGQILALTPRDVYNSWGVAMVAYTTYNGMPMLVLVVNGFLHKGPVFISYNRGEDLYEVRTVKNHTKEVEVIGTTLEVYADSLGEVIDRMVEKNCSQEEYVRMVDDSLKS